MTRFGAGMRRSLLILPLLLAASFAATPVDFLPPALPADCFICSSPQLPAVRRDLDLSFVLG